MSSEKTIRPDSWTYTELGNLVPQPKDSIVDGPFGSNLKASEYVDSGVPIIRLQNVDRNDFINKNIKYIRPEKAQQLSRHNFKSGDIIITKLGCPLGKATIVPSYLKSGIVVADIVRMRVDERYMEKEYLSYAINSPYVAEQFVLQTKGTTRPRVNLKHIRNLLLPVAPLNEQKRIVDKIEQLFSNLDEGEALLKQVQKQLETYRQSVLKAAVTGELTREWREANKHRLEPGEALLKRILKTRRENWQGKGKYKEPEAPETTNLPSLPGGWIWSKMEQISLVSGGLTKNAKRNESELKLPMLRVANVYQNHINLEEVHEIGINKNEINRVNLEKNDLLIVEGNGSKDQIGRMAIWNGKIKPCVHQNHLIKARFVETDTVSFAMWWFMSIEGRDLIENVASSTSGLYTLSLSKVNNLRVPLPSKEEALEIVSRVDDIFSQIAALESWCASELTRSATLRQSILKDAFSGKLVPQDPADEPASELLKRIQAEKPKTVKAPAKRGRKKVSA